MKKKQQLNVMYCIIGNYQRNNKMGSIGKVFRNVPEHLEVRKMECIVKKVNVISKVAAAYTKHG